MKNLPRIKRANFVEGDSFKILKLRNVKFALVPSHATTQLAKIGVPAKAIAGRLGHADATITQNLYMHNTEKLQEEVATNFAKTLQTNH